MSVTATAPNYGVPFAILTAADSETDASLIVAPSPSFTKHSFIIKPGVGVSAGSYQVETTDDISDVNTWAQVGGGPVAVNTASVDVLIELTGVYTFLRLSVTTPIAGGLVNATYLGGK